MDQCSGNSNVTLNADTVDNGTTDQPVEQVNDSVEISSVPINDSSFLLENNENELNVIEETAQCDKVELINEEIVQTTNNLNELVEINKNEQNSTEETLAEDEDHVKSTTENAAEFTSETHNKNIPGQENKNIFIVAMEVDLPEEVENAATLSIKKPLVSYEEDEGTEEEEEVIDVEMTNNGHEKQEEEKENRQILLTSANKEAADVSQILSDWDAPQNVNGFGGTTDESLTTSESTGESSDALDRRKVSDRKQRLNLRSFNVSQEEVMKELIHNTEKPILAEKDLFLSIELAKRKQPEKEQTVGVSSSVDRDDIIGILEADQIKDWRDAIPSETQRVGVMPSEMQGMMTEMAIRNEMDSQEDATGVTLDVLSNTEIAAKIAQVRKTQKPTPAKSLKVGVASDKRTIKKDKETERILALKQLQDQFGGVKRREKRSTLGNPTDVAANDLKKAFTSTSISGGKKRRPCYLPDDQMKAPSSTKVITKEEIKDPDPVSPSRAPLPVKTYPVTKRKSEEHTVEVRTALDTLAAANKHLNKTRKQEEEELQQTKVKQEKKIEKKKDVNTTTKRANKEIARLLGDEGAIRMIYDATQSDVSAKRGGKKEFLKKVKVVQSEVMRAGQSSEKILRRKRTLNQDERQGVSEPAEAVFDGSSETNDVNTATPKGTASAKKKQKAAEASRILYRHSSSESFDSEGGVRVSTSEVEELDAQSRNSMTPVRKSSRPRKVSQKYATNVWMGDNSAKKQIKLEGPAALQETLTTQTESKKSPSTNETVKKQAKHKEPDSVTNEKEKRDPKEPIKIEHEAKDEERENQVLITDKKGIFTITLAPTKSKIENGLTLEVLEDLGDTLHSLASNKSCKVVLFQNNGTTFCQGMDLSCLAEVTGKQRTKAVKLLVLALRQFIQELSDFPKPIVAAVHGAAVGLGTAFLPFCDIVLASADATFCTPYAKLAQGLEGAASYTFRQLSRPLMAQLVTKAETITANEAVRWGLVTEPVPLGTFETELDEIVNRLVGYSTEAVMTLKSQMVADRSVHIEEALDIECETLQKDWNSIDCITAFTDRVRAGVLLANHQVG